MGVFEAFRGIRNGYCSPGDFTSTLRPFPKTKTGLVD